MLRTKPHRRIVSPGVTRGKRVSFRRLVSYLVIGVIVFFIFWRNFYVRIGVGAIILWTLIRLILSIKSESRSVFVK